MTDRTPEQKHNGSLTHQDIPPSNEKPAFNFGGMTLQEAIDQGLVHYVDKDSDTGEITSDLPDTLAEIQDPSKTEQTPDYVPLADPETPQKRGLGKKAVAIITSAALTATAGVIAWALSTSANRGSSNPTPTASGPANPGTPNTTPSSSETTPGAPNLPFDSERVAIMQKETADEFLENNGEMLRIQYVLSQQYDQVEKSADYEAKLVKKLPNGKILSDYNSFKGISLTAEADPQDVMYSYLYGQLGAIARTDVDEGIKALSAVVKDPKSSLFTDLRTQVENHTGAEADMSIITSRDYIALRAKRTTANDQTKLTIITEGGFQYEFVFKAVKGLEIANQNQKDDNEEVGVWLAESSKLGKVTIDF